MGRCDDGCEKEEEETDRIKVGYGAVHVCKLVKKLNKWNLLLLYTYMKRSFQSYLAYYQMRNIFKMHKRLPDTTNQIG